MRKAGFVLLLLAIGLLFAPSCAKKREVSIELLDPCAAQNKSFRSAAKYVEFAVFPNTCPDDKTLAAGDTGSARYHATVPATENLPDVGDLPKSKFGFAVILRDGKCSVIGFGCTEADLENISGIRVAACDWGGGTAEEPSCSCNPLTTGGGCVPPRVCVEGACKTGAEGDAGGCSLTVAAAGPLPDPVAPGASVTGPGIAATDNGFVIGYRDQSGATLRAVLTYLSDGGTLASPLPFDLSGCATKEPKDGVSLAFAGGSGLMVSSLPNCGSGSGAVFIPFDSTGNAPNAAGPRSAEFDDLTIAQGPSLAPAATSNQYDWFYRVKTTTSTWVVQRVMLQGADFKNPPPASNPFGEDETVPFGMAASSSQVRVYLAPVTTPTNTTVIQIGDNSSDTFVKVGEFSVPFAQWAALTAWDKRVAAAVPASVGMTIGVAELGGAAVTPILPNSLVGTGSTQGGALAVLRNHLLVAQGQSGKISVLRLEDAKGTLKSVPAGSGELSGALGAINLASFDGTHIAMAAARERVAVVWLSKAKLATGDPTGGWALLRCSQ